jgi:serine/threonine protein kinase
MKSLKLPCLSRPEPVLGSNEILTPIGAGGMGEVYRTRDTKLTRDVAIKVLPAALSNDADYMARFQREAQVLAALNQRNIAAIYDLEDHAIVMELVEGSTLAERIAGVPCRSSKLCPSPNRSRKPSKQPVRRGSSIGI